MIAEASLIGGIFGKGGGAEVRSALALQAFEQRFGASAGPRRVARLPRAQRPRSADHRRQGVPVRDGLAVRQDRPGDARPGLGHVLDDGAERDGAQRGHARRGAQVTDTPAPQAIPNDGSIGSQLLRHGARRPAACLQLGARQRQPLHQRPRDRGDGPAGRLLLPADPDGGGPARARASTPAARPSRASTCTSSSATAATTPGAPRPPPRTTSTRSPRCSARTNYHYLYKGQCLAMEKLERTNAWTPNASDKTPPGSEKLTAYRTVHGIVYARGTVGGTQGRVRERAHDLLPRGRLARSASPSSTTRAS